MKKLTTILHDGLRNMYFTAGIQEPVCNSIYREYRSLFKGKYDEIFMIIILWDSKHLKNLLPCNKKGIKNNK